MEKTLRVNLGEDSYTIILEKGLLGSLGKKIKELYTGDRIFVITDENVEKLFGETVQKSLEEEGYQVKFHAVPPGEASKSFSMLEPIYESLLTFHMTRKDLIITLGGGVAGDLGGFAASTYLRGIPFVQVPTSLLAQVDSSVGGKVAVDLPQGKNLVGSFYQPKAVFIDPDVLEPLSDKFYRDGMAEVIKYGCIFDEKLFALLETFKGRGQLMAHIDEIVLRCCDLKRLVVEEDERDLGRRMLLNFGHTLGHAIETNLGYSDLTHGEGVAIGMYQISRISEELGMTKAGISDRIKKILIRYGLPWQLPDIGKQELMEVMMNDKKNLNSTLNVILIKAIGESFIYKTEITFFDKLSLQN